VADRVVQLREHRLTGPAIASHLQLPRSTVGAILRRAGLGRLRPKAPDEPVRRYEWRRPGDLIHLDIKKLGRFSAPGHRATGTRLRTHRTRGAGWDFIHVCVDDHSRLAYVEVLANEKKETAVAFLKRARVWLAGHGITVERVMTDNGACYRSNDFRKLVAASGAKHIFTKPYTPRTNGKAERFIQTLQREWAYGRVYQSSAERNERLWDWLNYYNHQRLHGGIGHQPPISRIDSSNRNNGPGHDS